VLDGFLITTYLHDGEIISLAHGRYVRKLFMTDVLNFGKKLFTFSVVAVTIVWSMGLAALVPTAVHAEECPAMEAGDLVKMSSNNAVFLVGSDMNRYFFPNMKVFTSWFPANETVQTVAQSCISALDDAGQVFYRPGSVLMKNTLFADVYAVLPNGQKSHVNGEAVVALYGENWEADYLVDFHDVFLSGYTKAADLNSGVPHDGMLVKTEASTAAAGDVYYVSNGEYHMVSGSLGSVLSGSVMTVSSSVFDSLSDSGSTITASEILAMVVPTSSGTTTPPPAQSGNLTVSLAASTPAAKTLSASTVNNSIMTVRLTAGSKAVSVDGLTVRKTGLIADARVNGVSVWVDGYRMGDVMSSFNADHELTLGFGGTALSVPANGYKDVTIAFNFDGSATSGTIGAQITAMSAVDTTANVTGNFPINSATFSLTDGTANLAGVYATGQSVGGQSTEPSSSDTGQMEIGETKEIAKIKFSEDGVNNAKIEQLTFFVEGSVQDSDLVNFEVYAPDNTLLGSAAKMSDRYVTIKFDSAYDLPEGTDRTLTLKATAMDGASRWFRMQLQNDYDVLVKDGNAEFYVLARDSSDTSDTSWSAVSSTNGYFKLKAGTVTVAKRADSASGQLAAGATAVTLGSFDVRSVGEAVEVRKIGLQIATSSAATRLTGNVKVMVDGSTVLTTSAASNNLYSSASTQYTLSTYFTIPAGETKTVSIVASVDQSAVSTSEYQVKLGNMYLKRLSTKDFVDNKPSSTLVSANNLTMSANTFTIAEDTALPDNSLSAGNTNVLGQWILKGPSAQSSSVTAIAIDFTSQAGAMEVSNDLQNLTLWKGDTQLGSSIATVATNTNNFTFNNLPLAANETVTVTLKGTVLSTATSGDTVTAEISSLTWLGDQTQSSTDDTTDYAAQTNTVQSASVTIGGYTDATTIGQVLTPSGSTQVQLGKWEVVTLYDSATFNKLRLELNTTGTQAIGVDTASTNFGQLALYDSADMTKSIATGTYIAGSGNGYVEFSGMDWKTPANSTKYLVLKGVVAPSSNTFSRADVSAWALITTSTTNFEAYSGNGTNITTTGVSFESNTSTYNLFMDNEPVVSVYNVGSTLELSTQAKIFGFTVTNPGTVPLSFASTTISVSVSGLTSSNSNTGTIDGFQLWEANSSGGLATLIASSTSTCLAGGAGVTGCSDTSNSASVSFGSHNDVNSLMDSLNIPAGDSRTFILIADTEDVLDGKSQGTVTVSGRIDGDTGPDLAGNNTGIVDWESGNFFYTFIPAGTNNDTSAYRELDSYDIVGSGLSRSA